MARKERFWQVNEVMQEVYSLTSKIMARLAIKVGIYGRSCRALQTDIPERTWPQIILGSALSSGVEIMGGLLADRIQLAAQFPFLPASRISWALFLIETNFLF